MPTRNAVLTEQTARLAAFREAVAVGIADIDARRYTEFESMDALDQHLADIADQVLSSVGSANQNRSGRRLT